MSLYRQRAFSFLTQVLSLSHIIFRFLYHYSQQRAIPMVLLKMQNHSCCQNTDLWHIYVLAHMCFLCDFISFSLSLFFESFFYTVQFQGILSFGPQNHLYYSKQVTVDWAACIGNCSLLLCLRSSGSFRTFVNS